MINRREFIEAYRGSELDPNWLDRVAEMKGRGWATLIERHTDRVRHFQGVEVEPQVGKEV